MFAPTLLEPDSPFSFPAAKLGEAIERDLLAGAMLHHGEVAVGILRVVRVAGPERHDFVQAITKQRVRL